MSKNLNQIPAFYREPKHVIEGDLDGLGFVLKLFQKGVKVFFLYLSNLFIFYSLFIIF